MTHANASPIPTLHTYPTEPFENESDSDFQYPDIRNEGFLIEQEKDNMVTMHDVM